MRRRAYAMVALSCIALLSVGEGAAAQTSRPTELYFGIAQFKGPDNLGASVSQVLNLHIWRTLRRYPGGDSRKGDFGLVSVWNDELLDDPMTHDAASRFASTRAPPRDLMLWGKVHRANDKAIALAYLTIPGNGTRLRNIVWTVHVTPKTGSPTDIAVDLPQRAYAFHSISLPAEFVSQYSTAFAIPITTRKGGGEVIKNFGHYYRVANEGDYVRVRNEAGTKFGWMYLPQISANSTELTDFIGGLIRILRADWRGALELLDAVVKNRRTPTSLRVDSYLLMIRAKSELGEHADKEVTTVLELAPGARRAVQYALMYHLKRCHTKARSLGRATCDQQEVERFQKIVQKSSGLFRSNDEWYANVATAICGPKAALVCPLGVP